MSSSVTITRNIFASKGAQIGTEQAVTAALVKVTAQAKLLCPVDKGQLANSIMWRTEKKFGGFNNQSGDPAPKQMELNLNIRNIVGVISGYVGTNSDHWFQNKYPQHSQKVLHRLKRCEIPG